MQDRFKFRVWSKKYNKFIEDNSYPIGSDYQLIITQGGTLIKLGLGDFEDDYKDSYSWGTFNDYEQDCIVMQCTGLKDKNGKLIYEGDIVKNNQNSLYFVKFEEFEHQTKFCLKRVENPNYYPHISTWQGIGYKDQKNYEVIGNIYENKELLNE